MKKPTPKANVLAKYPAAICRKSIDGNGNRGWAIFGATGTLSYTTTGSKTPAAAWRAADKAIGAEGAR